MLTIVAPDQMHQQTLRLVQAGRRIAFVPTMGYFHEGHLELMRQGKMRGDVLIISIFVNPTQFGPSEDFEAYPRDLDRDLALAQSVGVDMVFAPEAASMYEESYQTRVDLDLLPNHLCGLTRAGHFRGVATVVAKLFNIVRPEVALFGEKDYQQLAVIRQMVRDLNFDIEIVGIPTVREPDGLAMSSRNTYLSQEERVSALSLFKALEQAKKSVSEGITEAVQLIREASALIESHPHTRIDYVALCDPETLENVERVGESAVMALAVRIGKTRLIDNAILKP